MKLVHGSLFSGFDAPSVAASWMGWKNAFHCEINPFCNEILKYWFPNSEHYEDITKTDFSQWKGRIDVLTGGFPCQPFSLAGQRKGADDNRYLWPHMLRAIREIRPAWVIGENVAGILTMVQPGKETEAKPLFSEKITEKEYCYDKSMLSKPSVKTLSEKDIPSNRCLFRLVLSERPTEETECGLLPTVQTQGLKMCDENGKTRFYPMELLPTPMASDATTGAIIGKNDHFITTGNGTPRKINQNGINGSVGLARMVQLLPTPNAREADKYSKKYNPKSQMGTALTAMAVNGMLPTPTNSMVTYQDFIQAGYHSSKRPDYGLIPTPTASSHHNGCCKERKDGTSRKSELNHYIAAQTGKTSLLNPLFVEEMMGFPLMWTTLPFLSQSGDRNQSKDTETP